MDKKSNTTVSTTNEHSEENRLISRTRIFLSRPKSVDNLVTKQAHNKTSTEKNNISRTTIYLNQPKKEEKQI